ncbi:MAG: ABC transporter ATP-binding protein [Alphaproteobacteria bacterium]|nr:ABC transporter ATP-binding protein [Alphaproteobacteria bacterium]
MHGIEFRDVAVRYGSNTVLHGLSLAIAPSEFLALLGPSGCGKTTMLRVLAGFVPYAGSVLLDGRPIDAVPTHRRGIGIVFQDYALFPHRTVAENIAFGLRMRGGAAAAIGRRVEEMLELLRLGGLGARYPGQLSGGQQQRVALARAIAIDPPVLLLDEPLSSLDKKLREEMQIELRQLQKRVGITTVFVTHDQEEALAMADRIAVMNGGRIQQIGTPREIYARPANRFVADFIGRSSLHPVRVAGDADGTWRCTREDGTALRAVGPASASPGAAFFLSVRPESIALAAPDHVDPALNVLDAVVEDVVFQGGVSHVRVRAAGGALFACEERGPGAGRGPGERVRIAWTPEDGILVPE